MRHIIKAKRSIGFINSVTTTKKLHTISFFPLKAGRYIYFTIKEVLGDLIKLDFWMVYGLSTFMLVSGYLPTQSGKLSHLFSTFFSPMGWFALTSLSLSIHIQLIMKKWSSQELYWQDFQHLLSKRWVQSKDTRITLENWSASCSFFFPFSGPSAGKGLAREMNESSVWTACLKTRKSDPSWAKDCFVRIYCKHLHVYTSGPLSSCYYIMSVAHHWTAIGSEI